MPLVKTRCTSCGGELEVNPDAECLICKYCGSPFIVSNAINNYNTTINNHIVANNVIIQGKNVDALVKRGKELLCPDRIKVGDTLIDSYQKQVNELKEIAKEIISQDANNFYGRLFLIDAYEGSIEDLEICKLTQNSKEKEEFVNYLSKFIKNKLRFLDSCSEETLYLCLKDSTADKASLLVNTLKDLAESDNFAASKLDEINDILANKTAPMYQKAANVLSFFYFSEDAVKYSLTPISDLVTYLYTFGDVYGINLDERSDLKQYCQTVFNVINANKSTIMLHNAIYGHLLIEYAYKLIGKEVTEDELNESTKVEVRNIWTSRRKTTAILYSNKVVFNIDGCPSRTIMVKDILFLNMIQTLISSTMRTTLWYDLVYKTSDTTYTLIHFGYDMLSTESFYNCKVYSSISSWAIHNGVRTTDVKYSGDNPFEKGYNGLSYEYTQPSSGGTSKGGCYVATCVYGSYDCPQVWVLRRYRDNYLDNRWWGRAFIKVYYAISPTIVKIFGKTKAFNKINRHILDKKIKKLSDKGYEDTKYNDKY